MRVVDLVSRAGAALRTLQGSAQPAVCGLAQERGSCPRESYEMLLHLPRKSQLKPDRTKCLVSQNVLFLGVSIAMLLEKTSMYKGQDRMY